MQTWPLLDIREALADADRNLADVISYTQTLQGDTEGHMPPDAATLLANIAAVREMLTEVLPPALVKAITAEQKAYDEETARWEPTHSSPVGSLKTPPPPHRAGFTGPSKETTMSLHSQDDSDAYGPQTEEEREQEAVQHPTGPVHPALERRLTMPPPRTDRTEAEIHLLDQGLPLVLGTAAIVHALSLTQAKDMLSGAHVSAALLLVSDQLDTLQRLLDRWKAQWEA